MRVAPVATAVLFAGSVGLALPASAADIRSMQDWNVTCEASTCTAHFDGTGVQMIVAPSGAGLRRTTVRISPNSAQGEPVAIRLDSGWQAGLTVVGCDARACVARVAAERQAAIERAFAAAREGVVAYKVENRLVIAPISLMGFTAATDMVE